MTTMIPWTADAIKQLRTRLGLTQAGLASAIGAHPSAVAMWEQGKRQPTGLYAAALAGLARTADPATTLPPRLSESLTDAATAADDEAAAAIADGQPEAAASFHRMAGHLRRLAYTHRAAAAYQQRPDWTLTRTR